MKLSCDFAHTHTHEHAHAHTCNSNNKKKCCYTKSWQLNFHCQPLSYISCSSCQNDSNKLTRANAHSQTERFFLFELKMFSFQKTNDRRSSSQKPIQRLCLGLVLCITLRQSIGSQMQMRMQQVNEI